ncbi:MAG: TolC family protein [Gemmatimonadaceae bacterium]
MRRHCSALRVAGPVVLLALSGVFAPKVGAQLTLADALRQGDQSAYGNRVARGTARAQAGLAIAPLQAILPDVRLEAGYARTADPIGVFGDRLRQGTITQADFDPTRLNHPGAISNYQSAVVLEQPLFNADSWAARAAANHGANASRAAATWTALSTRVEIVRGYYGAVLAGERAAALTAASRSAHAHVTQTQAMVRQGLVTRSDALLAEVRAGDMDAQLAQAKGDIAIAQRQLAVFMGRARPDIVGDLTLPDALPSADRIRAIAAQDTGTSPDARADVEGAVEASAAARSDALRARAGYLPRVNSFVRYDWNTPNAVYSGERNWTVGVMASWRPFGNAAQLSDVRAASGRAAAAQAKAEGAEAQATLNVAETRISLSVALARLDIAQRSVEQSAEAHRIVARKYAGGLASIVELLDAQATEVQSSLGFAVARYNVIVAVAESERATGRDPGMLAALDDGNGNSVSATPSVRSAALIAAGSASPRPQ